MQHFLDLDLKERFGDKPWLVLGKGPSFNSIYSSVDITKYNILCLNHTANLVGCQIAHAIDLEVLNEDLLHNADLVVMPEHPHFHFKPVNAFYNYWYTVLDAKNKLYNYSLSTWKNSHTFSPVITAKVNSAEAAFELLIRQGVKLIYSLGIDGGKRYSHHFEKLGLKPLTNSQLNFDNSNYIVRQKCLNNKVNWVRL